MSIKRPHTIACQLCGKQQTVTVWETVNVQLNPVMKDEVIEQRVNVFECVGCHESIEVDINFMYNDMDKRFCVRYISQSEVSDANTYTQFKKDGTLAAQGMAHRLAQASGGGYMLHPHCVFSMRELAAYVLFRELCEEYGQ